MYLIIMKIFEHKSRDSDQMRNVCNFMNNDETRNVSDFNTYPKEDEALNVFFSDPVFGESDEFFEIAKTKFSDAVAGIEYCFFDYLERFLEEDVIVPQNSMWLIFEYIDRGVHDWAKFGANLKKYFPKLRGLVFAQNYSYPYDEEIGNYKTDEESIESFLNFIKNMNLTYLFMFDNQTSYLRNVFKPEQLIEIQPPNSCYRIVFHGPAQEYRMYEDPDKKCKLHMNYEIELD